MLLAFLTNHFILTHKNSWPVCLNSVEMKSLNLLQVIHRVCYHHQPAAAQFATHHCPLWHFRQRGQLLFCPGDAIWAAGHCGRTRLTLSGIHRPASPPHPQRNARTAPVAGGGDSTRRSSVDCPLGNRKQSTVIGKTKCLMRTSSPITEHRSPITIYAIIPTWHKNWKDGSSRLSADFTP